MIRTSVWLTIEQLRLDIYSDILYHCFIRVSGSIFSMLLMGSVIYFCWRAQRLSLLLISIQLLKPRTQWTFYYVQGLNQLFTSGLIPSPRTLSVIYYWLSQIRYGICEHDNFDQHSSSWFAHIYYFKATCNTWFFANISVFCLSRTTYRCNQCTISASTHVS